MTQADDLLDSSILIVEDDPTGRAILARLFQRRGFKNLIEAENGRQAIEKMNTDVPDLVVTDISMPEMDGYELCRYLRGHADPRISDVPILVQTAMTNPKEKAAAFAAGASDYVGKPIDPNEVAARSRVHLERGLLLRNLRDFKKRVGEELELAKDTQRVLVPSEETLAEAEKTHRLSLSGHFQSCSELGGDFWGIRTLSPDAFSIYTVDFCGHGVNGALNVFRLHALMNADQTSASDPGAYMARLNDALEKLLPSDQFATMFYGVVDCAAGTLSYAGAGAPPPFLLRAGASGFEKLDTAGAPLGAWADVTYPVRTVPFAAGDSLLLYSDALTETPGLDGTCLAPETAASWFLSSLGEGGARQAFEQLLKRFQAEYIGKMKDDLTLVACQRLG